MKLLRTTLHNYRVYAGKQVIDLAPPNREKTVILIGGLNGEGKTTLLEGIQLALYGRRSDVWSQNGNSYSDYLAQSIHRGADKAGGAMIEVEFEAIDQDVTKTFKVQRSWKVNGGGNVYEHVQVFTDGQFDNLLSETWGDAVERFIPARLAGLFFFDGEKISHYADPQRAQELIERGLLSLLGIDLLDQLDVDLKGLETRITKAAKKNNTDAVGEELENARDDWRKEYVKYTENSASLLTQHDQQIRQCEELDSEYEKLGGTLFEQRLKLEGERNSLVVRRSDVEMKLIEYSGGVLPLALIKNSLVKCQMQMQIEIHADRSRISLESMVKQKKRAQKLLKKNKVAQKTRTLLSDFFNEEISDLRELSEMPTFLDTDEVDFLAASSALEEGVPNAQSGSGVALDELEEIDGKLQALDRKLASVPDDDAIAEVLRNRESARHELALLEGRRTQVEEERRLAKVHLDEAEAHLHKHMVRQLEGSLEGADDARVLEHADKVRNTLKLLRKKLIHRKIDTLSEMIRDSYVHLMRKKGMIKKIEINPDTYQLALLNGAGQTIAPEWLSAGERQLLVVSILWGFARASGRSLPIIVDTPLGRLDSAHRSNLVKHYFPHASHQVILLSTDEEIVGSVYRSLKPSIGQTYRLVYDDKNDTTSIEKGYFKEKAHAN